MTHQVERKLNKTTPVRISGERGPFRKSTVKVGLKQRFRHQNPQLRHATPDSIRLRGQRKILGTKSYLLRDKQLCVRKYVGA